MWSKSILLWMRDVLKVAMESNLNVVMELYHVRKYKYRQNIYLCEFTRYQEGKLVRDWGKIVKSDTALLFLNSNYTDYRRNRIMQGFLLAVGKKRRK